MSLLQWIVLLVAVIELLIAGLCLVVISVRLARERGARWALVGFLGYAFIWGWRNVKKHDLRPVMWTWTIAAILFVGTFLTFAVTAYFQKREAPAPQDRTARTATAKELVARAQLLENNGQSEKALAFYREAVQIEPGNTGALNALASCYEKQARYRDAQYTYLELIDVSSPPNRETYASVARVLRAQGYTAAAADYERLATAKRLGPGVTAPQHSMYASIGDPKDWRNPRVTISSMIFVDSAAGRREVYRDGLADFLVSLPISAWPYGRVIMVSETGYGDSLTAQGANSEAAKRVFKMLGLDVVHPKSSN